MKYLIYGGTSLISIKLIKKLINKNNHLNFIVFVRSKSKFEKLLASFNLTKYLDKIDLIEINITNLNENLNLISKFKDNSLSGLYFMVGVTGNPDDEFKNTSLLKKNFDVNLINPILLINSLISKLEKNSHIVVFTSIAGLRGRAKRLYYCSAKAGLINYLSGLRQSLFTKKIAVINFTAGYMATETFNQNIGKKSFLVTKPEKIAEKIIWATNKKKDNVYNSLLWKIIGFIILIIPEKIFKRLKF